MEKKNIIIVAVCGIVLAVFLAVASVKIMQNRAPEPPAVAEISEEVEQPEEKPVVERRHGPKEKKKVDIASTFSDWGGAGQDKAQDGEPHKGLHEQTPEEAVESLWQGLDTYRELSDEDKGKAKIALGIVNLIINAVGDNADKFVAGLDEQKRAETIEHARISIENINAMEAEVAPDMTDEEREVIGGMLLSIRNLNTNLLNALQ